MLSDLISVYKSSIFHANHITFCRFLHTAGYILPSPTIDTAYVVASATLPTIAVGTEGAGATPPRAPIMPEMTSRVISWCETTIARRDTIKAKPEMTISHRRNNFSAIATQIARNAARTARDGMRTARDGVRSAREWGADSKGRGDSNGGCDSGGNGRNGDEDGFHNTRTHTYF